MSGLIYAAIAIMWAVVLIPMWLRNHDTAAENRSAERFGQAMRILSRKEQEPAEPAADDQSERLEQTLVPSRQAQAPQADRRRESRPTPRKTPHRTLAQRRARTLAVLAGLTVLFSVVAALTPVPWWAPLPLVTLLGAFVVHLRIQARQQKQRRSAQVRREPEPAVTAATGTEFEQSASGFVSGPSRVMVVETKGADASAGAEDDETWRPNPLPLPTYVTAPKAIRPIKVIDLTSPGAWSSGRVIDEGLAEEDLLAAEVADAELDALLSREAAPPAASDEHEDADRRAVGD